MKKCDATGKIRFGSLVEAMEKVFGFRMKLQRLWNGRRRKHRLGKPRQKRVYRCEYRQGYHLTSWESYKRKHKQNQAVLQALIIRKGPG